MGFIDWFREFFISPSEKMSEIEQEYGPELQKFDELIDNTTADITNRSLSLLDVNVSEYIKLSPSMPGAEFVNSIFGFIAGIKAFIFGTQNEPGLMDWLFGFIDIGIFFITDPFFAISCYELIIMAMLSSKQSKGDITGPEMLGEFLRLQFVLFDWIFKLTTKVVEMLISFARFLRDLVPFI